MVYSFSWSVRWLSAIHLNWFASAIQVSTLSREGKAAVTCKKFWGFFVKSNSQSLGISAVTHIFLYLLHICSTYQRIIVSVGLMTSIVHIIYAHILASKFSWNSHKWKVRVFIGFTNLRTGLLAASQYGIQPAIQCATWWSCQQCSSLWLCSKKGKVHMHEHEQQFTNTRKIILKRCNMYTLPSNSSMHSHMRRFLYRPTTIITPWLFIFCTNAVFRNSHCTPVHCSYPYPRP